MRKLVRILALTLLAAMAAGVAAIALAPHLVDPNDHRERIAAFLGEQTGREVRLEGALALSVFPWLGLDAREVVLGNATGFDGPLFARAERLEIRVKLLPLLQRAVEMDTVKIAGLELRLARDADGRVNWADLAGTEQAGGAEPLAALALGGVEIEGGALVWDDRQLDRSLQLGALVLRTGELRLGVPVPVALEFDLVNSTPALSGRVTATAAVSVAADGSRITLDELKAGASLTGAALDDMQIALTVAGAAEFDAAGQRAVGRALEIGVAAEGGSLPGGAARLDLAGDGAFDLATQQLEVSSLDIHASGLPAPGVSASIIAHTRLALTVGSALVEMPGLTVAASVSAAELPGGQLDLSAGGDLLADLEARSFVLRRVHGTVPALSLGEHTSSLALRAESLQGSLVTSRLRADALELSGELPATGPAAQRGGQDGQGETFTLGFDADVDLAGATATLGGLSVRAGALQAAGEATLTGLGAEPRIAAALSITGAAPRELAALAGIALPATADDKALASLGGDIALAASAAGLEVERMRLVVDETTLQGSAHLPAFSTRGARFDLVVDRIDLDRYLPRERTEVASPGAAAAAASTLPLAELRALDLDGRLRAGKVRAGGLDLASVEARLKARDGLVALSPARAALYGGTYSGKVTIDARGEELTLTVDEKLESVDATALARALGVDAEQLGLSSQPSSIRLAGIGAGDPAAGRLRLREVDLQASLAAAHFPGQRLALGLGGAFDIDLGRQTATSDAFVLRFGGMRADGKLAATQILDDPHLAGAIATSEFDLAAVLTELGVTPPRTADPRALRTAKLRATLTASSKAIALRELDLRIDESRIVGTLEVDDFERPAIRLDLDVDRLDADRYLPPATRAGAATPGAAAAFIPVAALRALDLRGELRIGLLRVGGVRVNDARINAAAKDGQARLHPLSGNLYGGTYQGNVRVDARGAIPAVALEEQLAGVEIGALLDDVSAERMPLVSLDERLTGLDPARLARGAHAASWLSGRTDLVARLGARGGTTDALKASLSGDVSLRISDGAFNGMNITRRICTALASGGIGATAGNDGGVTRFTSLTGTAVVRDGVVTNEDLAVSSPLLRITGAGGASLVTQRLNYGARVMLEDRCQSEGGLRLAGVDFAEIGRSGVPLRCQGSFDAPQCGPDTQFVAPLVARQVIERTVGGRLGDVLKGDTGNAVNSIIQGIIGQ